MNRQELTKKLLVDIKKFPDTPGVYFFRGQTKSGSITSGELGEILYIGKATSLRDRVRSYFSRDLIETRGPKLVAMLDLCESITFQSTDSVLEALLLESYLIKRYQPVYNTKEKDDKSFYYVIITKEEFPRVLQVRGRDLLVSALQKDIEKNKTTSTKEREIVMQPATLDYEILESFGPFPSGTTLKEALHLIRKIFPYRDKCIPKSELKDRDKKTQQAKPCFNYQLGLCPGVCTGAITASEYKKTINNIIHFFRGEKKVIIKNLEGEMKAYAKARAFEKANQVKKQIFALNHIHDISLIKEEKWSTPEERGFRIESYDIAHLGGDNVVGVMVVLEDGEMKKSDYRKFKIKDNPGINDTKALKEVLTRRLGHNEWPLPQLIVVDGGVAQKHAMETIIAEHRLTIPVVSVVKDEHHKPKEILGNKIHLIREKPILLSNAEAHRFAISFHKTLRNKKLLA